MLLGLTMVLASFFYAGMLLRQYNLEELASLAGSSALLMLLGGAIVIV